MKWSQAYATGVPVLDEQHRMLFQMSEDYRETLLEGRGERVYPLMLEALEQYARAHFGSEEACMYRYQCPVAATNTSAHAIFVARLAAFRQRYEDRGFETATALELVTYVDEWLMNHIARIDARLKPCIESGPGGAP